MLEPSKSGGQGRSGAEGASAPVTPPKPSRRGAPPTPPRATLLAMLRVVIRVDAAGEWPILVGDGEELPARDGVSFRHVCDVATVAEGKAVRSAWLSRRMSPEVLFALEGMTGGLRSTWPQRGADDPATE